MWQGGQLPRIIPHAEQLAATEHLHPDSISGAEVRNGLTTLTAKFKQLPNIEEKTYRKGDLLIRCVVLHATMLWFSHAIMLCFYHGRHIECVMRQQMLDIQQDTQHHMYVYVTAVTHQRRCITVSHEAQYTGHSPTTHHFAKQPTFSMT